MYSNLESDNGRGIVIYTKTNLQTRQEIMETPYQEYIQLSIRLQDSDELITGCI